MEIQIVLLSGTLFRTRVHGARRKKYSNALSKGWLRRAFLTSDGQDSGILQVLGAKPTDSGSYYKMSDSESATYQIVGTWK